MVTVVANNRIRRSPIIAKGVASTNIASTRKSLRQIRHPQTLIVITVGIAVLVLYSLEHSLVYESTHIEIRLTRPLRPWVQTSSSADEAPTQILAARRPQLSSTSRFGMIPKKYLRTSILRPLDTLDAKTDTSAQRRSIQHYHEAPPEGAIQNDFLHSSEEETVGDGDDNRDVTATPETFLFPRVMNLYELNQNSPFLSPLKNVLLTTPLPLDPCTVNFDIQTNENLVNNETTTYEQETFPFEREFLEVAAPKQRERFNQLCQDYQIILLDDLAILEKAAEIHADLRLRGLPIQTEDILIAATAIVKSLIVVSNDSDLLRVEGLSLENWVEL